MTNVDYADQLDAAFQLECYDNRMACVVTGDVFDEVAGYVTIFHEFVHCQQVDICEQTLKQTLGVARKARAAGDYMWEITHEWCSMKGGATYTGMVSEREPELAADIESLFERMLHGCDAHL